MIRYIIVTILIYFSYTASGFAFFEDKTLGLIYLGGYNLSNTPKDTADTDLYTDWKFALITEKHDLSVGAELVFNPYYQTHKSDLIEYNIVGAQLGFNVIIGSLIATTYSEYGINYGKMTIAEDSYENENKSRKWSWDKQSQTIKGYYGKFYQFHSSLGIYTEFGQNYFTMDTEYQDTPSDGTKEEQEWEFDTFYIVLGFILAF